MSIVIPLTLEVLGDTPTGMSVIDSSPVPLKWILLVTVGIALVVFIWRKRDSFIYHQT
ncbi:MAG: hypothetical protein AABY01_01315 [Nanoarchaeota archaeon]